MTTLSPKQRAETAVERALKRNFPQMVFKVGVNDALDRISVHWHGHGAVSHDAVNAVVAQAGRKLGFQYTPNEALTGVTADEAHRFLTRPNKQMEHDQ
jgi:hypothetical protein